MVVSWVNSRVYAATDLSGSGACASLLKAGSMAGSSGCTLNVLIYLSNESTMIVSLFKYTSPGLPFHKWVLQNKRLCTCCLPLFSVPIHTSSHCSLGLSSPPPTPMTQLLVTNHHQWPPLVRPKRLCSSQLLGLFEAFLKDHPFFSKLSFFK